MNSWFVRTSLWAALASAAVAAPAAAAPFSALYVFGDSLSDVGNDYAATGGAEPASPPYFAGRFTNGPNWADDLAANLGLGPLAPSLPGGTDFAFGGAATGPAVPGAASLIPDITQQVGMFSLATGGHAPSSALYAVWIGSNDVFAAVTDLASNTLTFAQAQTDLIAAAQTEAAAVSTLATEGAKTFLVPLVPDLGVTPDSRAVPASAPVATALSLVYDTALVSALNGVKAGTGATIDYLDMFTILDSVVADGSTYGLTDVTDRCYTGSYTGGGTVCATPDSYLFWDGLHPTAAADRFVASFGVAAVLPEPSAISAVLAGLGAMIGFAARRKR